jgi:hypothetical protein
VDRGPLDRLARGQTITDVTVRIPAIDLGVCAAQFVGGSSGQGVMNGRIQLSLSVADHMVER